MYVNSESCLGKEISSLMIQTTVIHSGFNLSWNAQWRRYYLRPYCMALCLIVSAALLHATGLGKRRWASPFLAVKIACNFTLRKNFRLECFQSVLYETETSGTLWLILGVNGTWWCFLLFWAFFLFERESCGQLSVQCCWLKNGGKLFCWWCLPIRVNCLPSKFFVVLFVIMFLSAAGWR